MEKQNWMILTKNWCAIEQFAQPDNEQNLDINYVFANRSDEEEICPLAVSEITEEQLNSLTAKSVPAGTKNSAKSVPAGTKNYCFVESLRRNSTLFRVV